jgi:hypothetical protein
MWRFAIGHLGSALENNHSLQRMKNIVPTRRLKMRWIAEGFISEERGKRLDQVAQSYINDLVNRSMILPVDIGYDGQVQSFQVHGLVLNIIQNMSAEHNFVTVVDGQQSSSLPKKIRRLSLHFNGSEDVLMGSSMERQLCSLTYNLWAYEDSTQFFTLARPASVGFRLL